MLAEREVAQLDRRRDDLGTEMTKAGADHVELARLGSTLAEVQAELEVAEERWLALAAEAEG